LYRETGKRHVNHILLVDGSNSQPTVDCATTRYIKMTRSITGRRRKRRRGEKLGTEFTSRGIVTGLVWSIGW